MQGEITSKIENKNIRIFIADDHKIILNKTVELLGDHFEIAGTAPNGQTALESIRNLKPDVVVLDISMPLMTGFEVAEALKKINQEIKIVFMTGHDDSYYREKALAVGALAFVSKSRLILDLTAAVESALAGKTFVSPKTEMPEMQEMPEAAAI